MAGDKIILEYINLKKTSDLGRKKLNNLILDKLEIEKIYDSGLENCYESFCLRTDLISQMKRVGERI